METFTAMKALVDNPHYDRQRKESLDALDVSFIDKPMVEIIQGFAGLSCCFTLQSCYGHFVFEGQTDRHSIKPLPDRSDIGIVEYRIAYLALCIENSDWGKELLADLGKIQTIDPDYVQLGCADWFWDQQVNSYALQVEPRDQMYQDVAHVDYPQALHIEKIRNQFIEELKRLPDRRRQRD